MYASRQGAHSWSYATFDPRSLRELVSERESYTESIAGKPSLAGSSDG